MLRLRLPEPPRERPGWGLVSLVVHLGALAILIAFSGPRRVYELPRVVILEPFAAGSEPRQVALPPVNRGGAGPEPRAPVTGGTRRAARALPLPTDTALPKEVGEFVIGVAYGAERDSIEMEAVTGTGRILGPAYGDGRLWVRPFEAEIGIVGPSPSIAAHVARVDSAVRERIKAYIDTMPRDSFALPAPPRWTTEVGDDTWGIDGGWIYLGDFKIPTALLALIPLPQGNYDQTKAAQELQRVREEIIRAARQAETSADFRRYVEEVRRRREAEREAERQANEAARRDTVTP